MGGDGLLPGRPCSQTQPPNSLSHATHSLSPTVCGGLLADGSEPTSTFTSASDAYDISSNSDVTLNQPMRVDILASSAPAHPQVGEAVMWVNGGWQRLNANFFRAGDRRLVSLTRVPGTVGVAHRRLQAPSGEAVTRGRNVFYMRPSATNPFSAERSACMSC